MECGNSDAQIALLIADAGNRLGVGTIWFPQQRTFFGGPVPGAMGNSIEWCDSNPPPGTPPHPAPPPVAGHTRGDIAFNRAGNPRAYIFDGNAWQPW